MARNSIYWYQNEKWISMMNRNGSINLYQSALSIIYGNTITQPTTQSPLSHCQHLIIHSLTDLTIHSLHNSLSCPFTHKTILLLLVHSLNHCFLYSLSNTNAIQFNSTFSHPHSFLHSHTQPCTSLTQLHIYVNMRVWKGKAALFGFPVCVHFLMECGAFSVIGMLYKIVLIS